MQSNRKKIGIFIIVLGLIIIALIIYLLLSKNKLVPTLETVGTDNETQTELVDEPITSDSKPSDAPISNQKYDINDIANRKINGDDLGKVAMSLAERFGSFSNQSNYGNFTDLKILMTDNMRKWVDEYVIELKKKPQNSNVYYGVTTQAMTYKIIKFDDKSSEAEILVSTRRSESTEEINGGTAFNQDLRVVFLKVEGEWLFDAAYWVK